MRCNQGKTMSVSEKRNIVLVLVNSLRVKKGDKDNTGE